MPNWIVPYRPRPVSSRPATMKNATYSKRRRARTAPPAKVKISNILNRGLKNIQANYSLNVTMNKNTTPVYYLDTIVRDIPKYSPTSVDIRTKNLELSRTDDLLYFKNIKLKITATNYGDKCATIRALLFRNDAWDEGPTATASNMFLDVNNEDLIASTNSGILTNQRFNDNLIKSRRSLHMDKLIKVNARTQETAIWNTQSNTIVSFFQQGSNTIQGQKHVSRNIKIKDRVEFESDVANSGIKQGRYYFYLLYSNDDDTNSGDCVVDYTMECNLSQA